MYDENVKAAIGDASTSRWISLVVSLLLLVGTITALLFYFNVVGGTTTDPADINKLWWLTLISVVVMLISFFGTYMCFSTYWRVSKLNLQ